METGINLYEHNATNNNILADDSTLVVSLHPNSDLQVLSATGPETVQAGSTAAVAYTIVNQGSVPATGRWRDSVYFSLDNILGNSDDILMFSTNNGSALGAGDVYQTISEAFTIPKRYQGPAYLLIKADADGAIDESPNEDNNVFQMPITITPYPKSDLVTSDVVSAVQAFDGAQLEVRFKVTNKGVGASDVSNWTDSIWLTTDRKRPHPNKATYY